MPDTSRCSRPHLLCVSGTTARVTKSCVRSRTVRKPSIESANLRNGAHRADPGSMNGLSNQHDQRSEQQSDGLEVSYSRVLTIAAEYSVVAGEAPGLTPFSTGPPPAGCPGPRTA